MRKYSELNQKRLNLAELIPLSKPFTVLFEPTSICNFSCEQCFHGNENFHEILPKGFMKMKDFCKIVDDLKAWEGDKIKVVRLIGFGEPMLNSDLGSMVSYLKKADVAERIEITSNCSTLTAFLSETLIESGLDYLRVSIYATNQKRHNKITNTTFPIDKIYENLRVLKDLRDKKGKKKPFIYIKMLDAFNEKENQDFFDKYTNLADEIAIEKSHQWLNNETSNQRIVCPQPFKMLSIHYNGDTIVCDPDWKGNTIIGNVFTEQIQNIWKGKRMQDFWNMQLEGRRKENLSCRHCSFINDVYVLDNIDCLSKCKLQDL